MRRSRRSGPRDVGAMALALGSFGTGILAYLYIAIGTRHYGAADFSGVAQVWTIWFFGSAVLTFPIQHWVIQRLRADGHGGAVRDALPRLSVIALAIGTAVGLVTFLAGDDLFGHGSWRYPVSAGVVTVGTAVMGLLRGGLAGRSRFIATGLALVGENLVRLVLGVALITVGANVHAYGMAIATGALVVVAWPGAVRFAGPATAAGSPFAFLGNVAGGTVIAQSVLTGGPVVLSLIGGVRAEVTSLFAALAVFRAPYIVALGLGIRATAALTDLVTAGRHDEVDRVKRRILLGALIVLPVGALGAALVGPAVLRVIFGDDVDLGPLECAGLAVGSLAALATLAMTLVRMADGHGGQVLGSWVIALGLGAVVIAVPGEPLTRVVAGFLVAELAAFAAMSVDGARPDRGPGAGPDPTLGCHRGP